MQTVYVRGGGGSQQREVADRADVVFTDTGRTVGLIYQHKVNANFISIIVKAEMQTAGYKTVISGLCWYVLC